jgi:acetyl-CoA carboxylase alpha subunit
MTPAIVPLAPSEAEIFEEVKIRHELEPVQSLEEFEGVIDEIIAEKIDFGEIHPDEDVETLRANIARRYNEMSDTYES